MYNEGAPDYVFDQGLYYPANSFGYVCSGFESTGDWEDQHRIFGLDSQDIHYTVAANESSPFVYYSPSYGYGQSPYNPYNPYIPGAVIGADGSIISPQQYYAAPPYENSITSAAYAPAVLQSRPDAVANGIVDPYNDSAVSVNKVDGLVPKHNLHQNTPNSSLTTVGDASNRRNSFTRVSEGGRANIGSSKQHLSGISSGSITSHASSQISQIRGSQGTENGLRGKASLVSSHLKTAFTPGNDAHTSVNKVKPNILFGRAPGDERVGHDTSTDQNRGLRLNKSKNQLVVKAYTTRAGNPDAQGNIIILTDQYNNVDFPVEHPNAKFFVIKSYSEDDVHKSIKYNVWSSTPNGNKKLNAAYEDAKRIAPGGSRGCPIFLFFSVNASGQFCGVAEMTGPVDFHRDMDFWQQDKWSGSFPVKWHFIKDVPNPNFRHIILENNENKPVTNSRDTQEIYYKKGLEMLRIFKGHTLKTSLLDDFMYYENRQRILHEERARLLIRSYENPYLVPLLDPPRKLQPVRDLPSIRDVNGSKQDTNDLTIVNESKVSVDGVLTSSEKNHSAPPGQSSPKTNPNNSANVAGSPQVDGVSNAVDELNISTLNISAAGEPESGCALPSVEVSNKTNGESVSVVTIGSMPIKVVDTESSGGFLTVGTIPLDPRNLLRN
ncbi:hypothetical protein ACS0TY_027165 [Phlomoides rotata]